MAKTPICQQMRQKMRYFFQEVDKIDVNTYIYHYK